MPRGCAGQNNEKGTLRQVIWPRKRHVYQGNTSSRYLAQRSPRFHPGFSTVRKPKLKLKTKTRSGSTGTANPNREVSASSRLQTSTTSRNCLHLPFANSEPSQFRREHRVLPTSLCLPIEGTHSSRLLSRTVVDAFQMQIREMLFI